MNELDLRIMALIFGSLFGLCLGALTGRIDTHATVTKECEKLGAFYVGDTVYECKPRGKV